MVVIDGPPGYTRRGREACLYQCYGRLKVGGTVVLDDLFRLNEQQTFANWLAVYPDAFAAKLWYEGHVLAVLEKQAQHKRRWSSFAFEDSWETTLQKTRIAIFKQRDNQSPTGIQ